MGVRAFGSRTSTQKTRFSCAPSDGVKAFVPGRPPGYPLGRPRDIPPKKMHVQAAFPFLIQTLWCACRSRFRAENDENDEDNSSSPRQGGECWMRGNHRNHSNDGKPQECRGANHGFPNNGFRHTRLSARLSRFLGRGCDEARFSEKKGVFSERGEAIQ